MRLWFERGFKAKPPAYELQKMFASHAFLGNSAPMHFRTETYDNDM